MDGAETLANRGRVPLGLRGGVGKSRAAVCGGSPRRAPLFFLATLVLLVGLPAHGVCQPVVVQIDEEIGGSGHDYDDPCFWRHPDDPDESLLLVTEKQGPAVDVFRLDTGEFVTSVTGFQRPNNCDVSGDLLVTTDAYADAVVVHRIPDFSVVGVIDEGFSRPMGVTVLNQEGSRLAVIADADTLDIHIHDLETSEFVRRFPTGFSSIEGVAADDLYERIYVAQDSSGGGVRAFSADGELIADFGSGVFTSEAEGVAVYRCGSEGWIVVSDQKGTAEFEVFDRRTLVHVGTFVAQNAGGSFTSATDGIDVFQTPTTRFPAGVFAACDRCGSSNDEVDVVSWDRIAGALGLAVCPDGRPPNCGNGVVDSVGEECDGEDDSACPGLCGVGCLCGDTAGNCKAAPNGSACTDGLFCNGADTCSAGTCSVHTGDPCPGPDGDGNCAESCNETADNCTAADPNGSGCNDGDACTADDICQEGMCNGSSVCGNGSVDEACGEECDGADDVACPRQCTPDCTCLTTTTTTTAPITTTTTSSSTSTTTVPTSTTTTTLPSACAVAPVAWCVGPGKGILLVDERVPGKEKLKLMLGKLESTVSQSHFGDPVTGTTRYTVCVYDQTDAFIGSMVVDRAGLDCGARPRRCWKAISTKGYKYNDNDTTADGIQKIIMKGGDAGKGKVIVLGKNDASNGQLSLPTGITPILQNNAKATVQVVSSDGGCFGVTTDDVRKADGLLFMALGGSRSDAFLNTTTEVLD